MNCPQCQHSNDSAVLRRVRGTAGGDRGALRPSVAANGKFLFGVRAAKQRVRGHPFDRVERGQQRIDLGVDTCLAMTMAHFPLFYAALVATFFHSVAQQTQAFYDPCGNARKFHWPVSSENWQRSLLRMLSATPA